MSKRIVFLGCVIACLVFFRNYAEASSGISKEWQACQSHEDCTAGVVCCECWEPINKKYVKEIVTVYDNCSRVCDGSCLPQNQPIIACVDNQCTVMYEEKRTDKTMEQWRSENVFKKIKSDRFLTNALDSKVYVRSVPS